MVKINDNIRLNDCDTVEITYSVPYKAAAGVNYYKFDIENKVTFEGKAVQPTDPSGTKKDDPEPDDVTNQLTVEDGTKGIKGIVKTIDDTDYDTKDVLQYTITVDLAALDYRPFYLYDELTVHMDGVTYRVDAEPKNMRVTVTDVDGIRTLINLADSNKNWVHDIWNEWYRSTLPEENYCAYLGKGVEGSWKEPGTFDLPFNPVLGGNWNANTSLDLSKDSIIEVTYDIDVDEEINLYEYNGGTTFQRISRARHLMR